MNYKIQTISHLAQRYETVGDYWWPQQSLTQVRVSDLQNEDYELLVIIHEMVEAHLAKKHGISDETITAFDEAFEQKRAAGLVGEDDEPGNDPLCPIHREHLAATKVEQTLAEVLGVKWDTYDKVVNSICMTKPAIVAVVQGKDDETDSVS